MGFDGSLTRKQFLGALVAAGLAPQTALAAEPETEGTEPLQDATGPLSVADLAAAEKVLGFQLTEPRRRLALAGVRSNLRGYPGIRDLKIPNSVEPNLVFTPMGRKPKPGRGASARPTPVVPLPAPATEDDLAFLSARELAALVRSRRVSPVELTEMYLKRLQTHGEKLQCVVSLTPDLAREQAKRAEAEIAGGRYRGPLHGLPYGIKDLFAIKGTRTTWGAEAFKDQMIDVDSTVYQKLTDAGAVCLAKLSCGALAYDNVWFGGATKNPWNTKEGSSGSSAGSACATAAGLAAFTIGTETLGSIISPSNRCRVSGVRPTYGRVSRHGGMTLTWTMDKVGPICRTVEDCALVLSAIVGKDPGDMATVDYPFHWNPKTDVKKLKIGVLYGEKEALSDRSVIDKADYLKPLLEAGATLTPVKFSSPPEGVWALLVAEAAAWFDELTRTEGIDKIGKLWPPEFLAARYMPAVEYINAHRARALMAAKFEQEFGDLDVVVTDHFWDDVFTICNGTGHPQAIIPWGVTPKNEPRSVSVVGRLYDEATVCAVANVIQVSETYHRLRPDADKY